MPARSRRVRLATIVAGVSAPIAIAAVIPTLASVAPANAAAGNARTAIANSHPSWATASHFRSAVKGTKSLTMRIYMAPRDQAALNRFVASVSNPKSASYHHYLKSSHAYFVRFGTTKAQVTKTEAWLHTSGLTVKSVAPHRQYLVVRGSEAAIHKAFGAGLAKYRYAGRLRTAPTQTLTVPSALAGTVLAVSGLSQSNNHMVTQTANDNGLTRNQLSRNKPNSKFPTLFRNARPCSEYYGQLKATYKSDYSTPLPPFDGKTRDYAVCGYQPSYLNYAYEGAAGYEGSGGYDGAGTTVAIVDAYASPTILSDARRYAKDHGFPGYAEGQFTQSTPSIPYRKQAACTGFAGWAPEETLDVESVHTMAPGANIEYYASASCYDNDFLDAETRVVDDDTASIVSNSWGEIEAGESASDMAAYQAVFEEGAALGIGFNFSSGDSGDEVSSYAIKSADSYAGSPYVTAVGGTSTAIGFGGNLEFATGWGTDKYSLASDDSGWVNGFYDYGAGGGFSALYNEPSYQEGIIKDAQSAGRGVPDISMDADPTTGTLMGETELYPDGTAHYGEFREGGTSLASPLLAGYEATLSQELGFRIGFANPYIYEIDTEAPSLYYDEAQQHAHDANVRVDYANGYDPTGGYVYSVRTFDDDASLHTNKGWDDVTGVGSPTPQLLEFFEPPATTSTARN